MAHLSSALPQELLWRSASTGRYAQTNLQLYGQLIDCGYSAKDLAVFRAGYDLALQLFSASFRGSGKPLLSHLVGTASILTSNGQPTTVVCAGLLHAAYALGDFGDGRFGIAPWKQARVRAAVGATVEDLVARYTGFQWNAHTIPDIEARVQALTGPDRDVLVIRLANELEDHLDCGVLYCSNGEKRREYIRSPLNRSVLMARQLGLSELADELEAAFAETLAAELPDPLRNCQDFTFVAPPASLVPSARVKLRRLLDRHPAVTRLLRPVIARSRPRG